MVFLQIVAAWNNDPFAEVPYSLVVSFEAIQADIPIYTPMVEAQIETEVQTETEIENFFFNPVRI